MAQAKAEAVRDVIRALLSNPAVDVSKDLPVDQVVSDILAWARRLRQSQQQHSILGQQLSNECAQLRSQFESLFEALGLRAGDLVTGSGVPSAVVEQLSALLCDESEKFEIVDIEPPPSSSTTVSAAADDAQIQEDNNSESTHTFNFPIKSHGILKLQLCKKATDSALSSFVHSLKSGPAILDLKIHRLYTVEGATKPGDASEGGGAGATTDLVDSDALGSTSTKDEKLPVEYQVAVGKAPWKRVLQAGALFAFFRSDRASAHSDDTSFLFSKHLRIEEEHTYLLRARPGDRFVCQVRPLPGSSPATIEASFLDSKLGGALDHLDAAHQAYSARGLAAVEGIVERVEGLRELSKDHADAKLALQAQEKQLAAARESVERLKAEIESVPRAVGAKIAAEGATAERDRALLVEQRLASERETLEQDLADALKAVEVEFDQDAAEDLASPGGEDRAALRLQRRQAEEARLTAEMEQQSAVLMKAKEDLARMKTATEAEKVRLAAVFAKATKDKESMEAGVLQQARLRTKRQIYGRAEQEIARMLAGHTSKLDAAVRGRREAICMVRNLPNQTEVKECLREWDFEGAAAKLGPFL
eukprot:INCI3072.1.p1 GENE.INCI3072.1~~INCI3072.1.p1  ORF type:complete len:591 (+),score=159.05 INCI3072.1:173-1945(+)